MKSWSRCSRLSVAIPAFCCSLGAGAQLNLTVLHSFNGTNDGQQPQSGLVQGNDGVLYGATFMGGSNNSGVLFKVNPSGASNSPIFHFGISPIDPFGLAGPSGLIQGVDGALYGTT